MAHELTINTQGLAEMAYVGEKPWHGLGQQLPEGADMDTWTKAAGMGWVIRHSPVTYQVGRGAETVQREVEGQHVLYRHDTGAALGVVSSGYEVVQPREVLDFFSDLVAEGGYNLHTAGTLFGGSKFWALAKVSTFALPGDDEVGGYLLITTSADGSRATEVRETTVRVVCNNTLTAALSSRDSAASVIRVSHRTSFNPVSVKARMASTSSHMKAFAEAATALSKAQVTSRGAERFVQALLSRDEAQERRPRGMDTILALFDGAGRGADLPSSRGTAWGLLNAVTEYVDHHATAKTTSHLLERAWMGSGDQLKTRALETLLLAV